MPAVLVKRNAAIPTFLHRLLPPITYEQFLLALFAMTSIPYLIAWFAYRERERAGVGMFLLLGVQTMMLVNVFTHATLALLIGGYAHGVVTAIAINLPFSVYLLRRAVKERWVSGRAMVFIVPTALLFHVIVLPIIIILSGIIANRL